jgi:single stranded DNA-binding protein
MIVPYQWHQIAVFGKVAEMCGKYLAKGRQVYVEGRLRTREYEARNNGGKRQRTEILASRVQFLGTPPTNAKVATAVEEPVPPTDSELRLELRAGRTARLRGRT